MTLSQEEVEARIVIYNELIDHLDMSIYESEEEKRQGIILKFKLRSQRDRFIKKYDKA